MTTTMRERAQWSAAFNAEYVTRQSGGGTFSRDTLAIYPGPAAGEDAYAVGGIIPGRTESEYAPHGSIADAVQAMRADMRDAANLLDRFDAYVGTWINDGTVYIDAVVILDNAEDARAMARANGELAFYSFRDGESVSA